MWRCDPFVVFCSVHFNGHLILDVITLCRCWCLIFWTVFGDIGQNTFTILIIPSPAANSLSKCWGKIAEIITFLCVTVNQLANDHVQDIRFCFSFLHPTANRHVNPSAPKNWRTQSSVWMFVFCACLLLWQVYYAAIKWLVPPLPLRQHPTACSLTCANLLYITS